MKCRPATRRALREHRVASTSIATHAERIAGMAERTNALSGETSSAATHLETPARGLHDAVAGFRLQAA